MKKHISTLDRQLELAKKDYDDFPNWKKIFYEEQNQKTVEVDSS